MSALPLRPRVLYVRTEGRSTVPREERRRRELSGATQRRILIEESFGFDLLGASDLAALPGWRGRILRRLPAAVALGFEVARRRGDYDVVVTWAEKYSVAVAGVLLWHRHRPRHLAIMDWMSKPVVRIPLRLVRGGVDEILTWSSTQARVATERLGFRAEQIVRIPHPVDDVFFAPADGARRTIFSAGETQRDFATLMYAVHGLEVPTVIAASLVGVFTGFRTRLVDASSMGELPANVEVRAMDAQELRRAYADAAIVVVPLVAADNNAGISVLLEAMSMGRPVIVTRTAGQHDVVVDGVTGLYVPPGDPAALRDAIRRLLDDPAAAEAMGRRARADVLAHHRADDFVARIREVAGMPAERVEEVRRA